MNEALTPSTETPAGSMVDLPVEYVVPGVPASIQAKASKGAWKRKVARRASAAINEHASPTTEAVDVQVVYYHDGPTTIDTDNMSKPIVDAMNGVVYLDDSQVKDRRAHQRDLDAPLKVRGLSAALAEGFGVDGPFVHVIVRPALPAEELLQ